MKHFFLLVAFLGVLFQGATVVSMPPKRSGAEEGSEKEHVKSSRTRDPATSSTPPASGAGSAVDPVDRIYSFLDPTRDTTFKKLFTLPDNKDILINFLNSALQNSDEDAIKEVELLRNEIIDEGGDSKTFLLDIRCIDQRGHHYIVEMERDIRKNYTNEAFCSRVQFYLANLHGRQLEKGDNYTTIKPSVCIVMTNSELFPTLAKDKYRTEHLILEKDTHSHFLKDMRWVFIELAKLPPKAPLATLLYQWAYLFKEGYKQDHLPKDCAPIIKKAYEVLDRATWTRQELEQYNYDIENERLLRTAQEHNKQLGLEEGLEKGREEGRTLAEEAHAKKLQSIAQNLLETGMPQDQIAATTGLSLDVIKALQDVSKKDDEGTSSK